MDRFLDLTPRDKYLETGGQFSVDELRRVGLGAPNPGWWQTVLVCVRNGFGKLGST